ncbi:MAG: ABC transporter ATP-binding protein [Caldicoprobacterales bacterium]|jgi:ATP-binding cassette subfamily B protein
MKDRIIPEFLRKYWINYLWGAIFLFLGVYIATLSPKYLGTIIDLLKAPVIDKGQVFKYIGLIILTALGVFATRYVWRYFIMGNARNMECFLRMEMLRHLQKMSVNFYNARKTGDLMAFAVNDIGAVRMSFGPGVALILNGLGTSLLSVFSMVRIVHPKLTVFAMLPIPIIIFVMIRMGTTIRNRFRLVQKNFASISDRINENISGIRVTKTYVQEDDEVSRFDILNNQMKQSNLDLIRVSSLMGPLIQLFFGICFMINLIYGSSLVKAHEITLGDFVAFNGYLTMIMWPVISIGRIINVFQRGMASYRRLEEIFSVKPEILDGAASNPEEEQEKLEGSLEIRNLSFAYPGHSEYALKDINIKLEKGQILGIIGRTGSGKTTLVNLLLKLYNVEPGKILIDGRDINDYSLKTLRENIGYVPQDNFLFSATIQDNIRYFSDQFSDDEIEDASKISMIYDNIMEFPARFDTRVGERGVNLSGGQKQRISIARAVIKKPAIYILDDALSAVDTQTEEAILNNLKEEMEGHTGIIIAHRISALRHADEIIVLDHGRIEERGSHEELIKKDGLYHELFREQYGIETRESWEDEE